MCLKFPNAVILTTVNCRNTKRAQISATECERKHKQAKEHKRGQKSAKSIEDLECLRVKVANNQV